MWRNEVVHTLIFWVKLGTNFPFLKFESQICLTVDLSWFFFFFFFLFFYTTTHLFRPNLHLGLLLPWEWKTNLLPDLKCLLSPDGETFWKKQIYVLFNLKMESLIKQIFRDSIKEKKKVSVINLRLSLPSRHSFCFPQLKYCINAMSSLRKTQTLPPVHRISAGGWCS